MDKESARKTIKQVSVLFYLLAVLQVIGTYAYVQNIEVSVISGIKTVIVKEMGPAIWILTGIVVAIWIALGFLLSKTKSILVASIMMGLSIYFLVSAILSLDLISLIIPLVFLIASVQAIRATAVLFRLKLRSE